MKPSIQFKTASRLQRWSTARRTALLLTPLHRYPKHCGQVLFVLACFALSPAVRAGCNNGCLSLQGTVLGEDALSIYDTTFSTASTAVGYHALLGLTLHSTDSYEINDTAVGAYALMYSYGSATQNSNTAVGAYALQGLPGGNFGSANTAVGVSALQSVSSAFYNVAVGNGTLSANNDGSSNTAVGVFALANNTSGDETAIGTNALSANTFGYGNTAAGTYALMANQSGGYNTAVGLSSLVANNGNNNTATGAAALYNNVDGNNNTATGREALLNNNASENTADGFQALKNNTTGTYNTATGSNALLNNDTGWYNTATGASTLLSNTSGVDNSAFGWGALQLNATGSDNTATGYQALYNNNADRNTATGAYALYANTAGRFNTADGYAALYHNIGIGNTATGYAALFYNTASGNSAFGWLALAFNTGGGANNSAFGTGALKLNTSGSNNIAVGSGAGSNLTVGSNNIDIGNSGVAGESNTIRVGTQGTQTAAYVAGISGTVLDTGIPVVVDANTGQLGITASSQRFKTDIATMGKASEAILALKPVVFHYKNKVKGKPQFGLIAEDVAKVNPDLVVRDADGKIYTVRYDAVNAMLLNEFLKAHRTMQKQAAEIQEQKAAIADLKKEMGVLTARFKEQAAQIQKVTARLEMNGTKPRVVAINQYYLKTSR